MTLHQVGYLLPEVILLTAAVLAVLAGIVLEGDTGDGGDRARTLASSIGILGSVLSMVTLFVLRATRGGESDLFSGTFIVDGFALYFKAILLVFAVVTILLGFRFAEKFRPHRGEFVGLILVATAAGMFMASAREMIELYVSLETLSVALYVMVAFNKKERLSAEAGFKYLVVGAASSAILLYGLAILYGLTGRTDLYAVARELTATGAASPAVLLAMVFVIGGFSFKIAAVPFHQWVPDVYQGAPTPVTAFVSVSSKVAAYALLARVLTSALLPLASRWAVYLAVIAALTMTVGNLTALSQTHLKRLLGYSSIAHAGYLIMGLVAISAGGDTARLGLGALLFYLLAYGLTNLCAFGAVQAIEEGAGTDEVAGLAGLGHRSPALALVLTLSLLSLTGIPPLVGFLAKFFIFLGAVQAGYAWLALIAVANSAVSSVYYLRVVRSMYFEPGREGRPYDLGRAMWTALGVGVFAILPFVAFASPFINLAQKGADAVLR
jgi:NADH-quinone oxidoreductase subunit N